MVQTDKKKKKKNKYRQIKLQMDKKGRIKIIRRKKKEKRCII